MLLHIVWSARAETIQLPQQKTNGEWAPKATQSAHVTKELNMKRVNGKK